MRKRQEPPSAAAIAAQTAVLQRSSSTTSNLSTAAAAAALKRAPSQSSLIGSNRRPSMERRTSMTERMRKSAPKIAPDPEPPAVAASKVAVIRRPSRSSMPTTLRQNPNRKSTDRQKLVASASSQSHIGQAPSPNLRGRVGANQLRNQSSYAGSMRSFASDLESISEYNAVPSSKVRPPRSITHSPPPVKSALRTSRPPSIASADGSEMRKSVGFSDQESDDGRSERMRSPIRRASPIREPVPKVPKLTTTADGKTLLKPPSSDLVEKRRTTPSQPPPQAVDSVTKLDKNDSHNSRNDGTHLQQSQAKAMPVVAVPKSAMKKGGNKKKRKEEVPVLPPIRHPSPLVKQNPIPRDAPTDSSDSASLYSDAEEGLPSILEALHEERLVGGSSKGVVHKDGRNPRVGGSDDSSRQLSDGSPNDTAIGTTESAPTGQERVTNEAVENKISQIQNNVELAPPILSTAGILVGDQDSEMPQGEDGQVNGEDDEDFFVVDYQQTMQEYNERDVEEEVSSRELGDREEENEMEDSNRIAAPSPRPFTSPRFTRESSESERPAMERHYSSESDTSFRRARPRQPRMRASLRQESYQRPASLLSEDLDDEDAVPTKKPMRTSMREFFPASRGRKSSVVSQVRPAHQRMESDSSFTKTTPRKKTRGLVTLRTSKPDLREPAPKINYNQSRYATSTEEDEPMNMGQYRTDDEPTVRTKKQGTKFFSGGQRKPRDNSGPGPEPILSKRTGKKKRFQFLRRLFGITD